MVREKNLTLSPRKYEAVVAISNSYIIEHSPDTNAANTSAVECFVTLSEGDVFECFNYLPLPGPPPIRFVPFTLPLRLLGSLYVLGPPKYQNEGPL